MKTPAAVDVLLMKGKTLKGVWIAHGLQLDVAGQGESITEALKEMQFAIAAASLCPAQSDNMPTTSVPEAPSEYWETFQGAEPIPADTFIPPKPHVSSPTPVSIPSLGEARIAS